MIKRWPVFVMVLSLLLASSGAFADGMPYMPKSDSELSAKEVEDGIIRLTPDRTRLLDLQQDAASVIVTNPDHATIALDSPRRLVIMPRLPGTTAFTVLDSHGQVIMQKSIVVTGAEKKYVRIRRVCGTDANCASNAYYYCPDGCYEVTPVQPVNGGETAPPPPGASDQISPSPQDGQAIDGGGINGPEDFKQPVQMKTGPGSNLAPAMLPE
jgi:hypothetical protein